jgi:hypothetical protein
MAKGNIIPSLIANILTIIAGVVLLITGAIFLKDTVYLRSLWMQIFGLSIFSMVVGFLAILFSINLLFFVFRQFPALTILFASIMIVVAIAAAVCGVILVVGRIGLQDKSESNLRVLLRNYSESNLTLSSKPLFGQIQQTFQCCGVIEATDWKNLTVDGTTAPDSCCRQQELGCGKGQLLSQTKIYLRGCTEPIAVNLKSKYTILFAMNFAVAVLALITAIAGYIFQRTVKQQYQSM